MKAVVRVDVALCVKLAVVCVARWIGRGSTVGYGVSSGVSDRRCDFDLPGKGKGRFGLWWTIAGKGIFGL